MLLNENYWQKMMARMDSLTVYRAVRQDQVLTAFYALCEALAANADDAKEIRLYYGFVSALFTAGDNLGLSGAVFRKYLLHLIIYDENSFSLACERDDAVKSSTLFFMARLDVESLCEIGAVDLSNLSENLGRGEDFMNFVPVTERIDQCLEAVNDARTPDDRIYSLMVSYSRMGAGSMASYSMFRIKRRALVGISRPDPVTLDDIIGYEQQKEVLIGNTEAFLSGKPANNILLAGSRGNGKSSCVKALANRYFERGLRLVEARNDQLSALPELMGQLEKRGQYFIVFMDDLSFEPSETQYKYLKSLLEGSAAPKPRNVLFYATSNRRHIVRESWGDRNEAAADGEIHTTDTVNEKLSLFDRFGITLTFPNLTQEEYIVVALSIAEQRGIKTEPEAFEQRAVQWALHRSVSGRTARQFVDYSVGF